MTAVSDIPIVGGILNALVLYAVQTVKIVKHPFMFVKKLDFFDEQCRKSSIEYYLAGIIVTYCIMIPILIKHKTDMSQNLFIIFQFLRQFIIFVCIHFALRIFGSAQPFRVTFILQNYLNSFFIPPMMLLELPYILIIGPSIVMGGFDFEQSHLVTTAVALRDPVVIFSQVSLAILSIWGMFVYGVWYSHAHKQRMLKVVLLIFVGVAMGFLIYQFAFLPLWQLAETYLITLLAFL